VPSENFRRVHLDPRAAIAGVDVGEDFLDLAIVASGRRTLDLRRIRLDEIAATGGDSACPPGAGTASSAIAAIVRCLRAQAPALANAIAIVDSPRWPVDLDLARAGAVGRSGPVRGGREIDRRLRLIVAQLRGSGAYPALRPLALFPTPGLDYFARRIAYGGCKPHLRAIGRELFGAALKGLPSQLTGGTFTRFMIAGFAAYRALDALGAAVYEGYPDLQFRLWCAAPDLPPKRGRRATSGRPRVTAPQAFERRLRVLEQLARETAIEGCDRVKTLDAADAAVLALSAAAARRRGSIRAIEVPAEGRFLVAMPAAETDRIATGLAN